ncbi:unnamed protein product [Lepeophtheirus salmonis]|uniref:(salmon louse) hypothetical protein n=1 Tax=Lepeophtheirus salmonis TaxID=72036 RepID=A0A7R8CCP4_LEPSM|nr:unnamed protein product [Lepeophtheirus salmonis]CAF2773191.1 unnamed protein product [Lepeophtheirus salmonis]
MVPKTPNAVLCQGVPAKRTPPKLLEGANPFELHGLRQIPLCYMDQVKRTLDDMVKENVIEKIEVDVTELCHPIVVIPKHNGKIRLTIDFPKLNSQGRKLVHHMKTPKKTVSEIKPKSNYITKFDALEMTRNMSKATTKRTITVDLGYLSGVKAFKHLLIEGDLRQQNHKLD